MSEQAVVTWVDLDSLSLWEKNYNQGDVGAITLSIQKFGFVNAVRVWHGTVMAGNHSIKAVRQLIGGGWQPYGGAIRVHDGVTQVMIVDISYIENETDARAFAIADNRTASLADPNELLLAELLQEVANSEDEELLVATGYDGDDLDTLLRDLDLLGDTPDAPEPQVDRAEELRVKWDTERGQIWQVGNHRLMCGDSTNAEDVAQLLNGHKPKYGLHDPPYGISVVNPATNTIRGSKSFGSIGGGGIASTNLYRPIVGDDKPFDPAHLFDLSEYVLLWGANYYSDKLPPMKGWIVWDKKGREDWNDNFSDCELAWTNMPIVTSIVYHIWMGMVREGKRETRMHPTQKPSEMIAKIINTYFDKGSLVIDCYLGSGATLVACEQTGRVGYGMEIDPAYIAVCLERLTGMGLEATLLNG